MATNTTETVLQALRAAAAAKGSPLSDGERKAVYASIAEPALPPVVNPLFTLPLAQLLAVKSNATFVTATEKDLAGKISVLASAPADSKNAVHVRKNQTVADGFIELAAAKKRGDANVFCIPATLQEEFSAH
jgi:hypothetical protein